MKLLPGRSAKASAYNAWYRSNPWFALRARHLRAEPFCRMCARVDRQTLGTMVDHIIPHRGDYTLFLDASNLQTLCTIHHGEKQREEFGGTPKIPVDVDGWPVAERPK